MLYNRTWLCMQHLHGIARSPHLYLQTSFMLLPVVSYRKKNCLISSNLDISASGMLSCQQ